MLYTGYGWFEGKAAAADLYLERFVNSSIEFGGIGFPNAGNQGMYFQNNVFYLARHALVHCYMPEEVFPVFEGNVYVQRERGWLAEICGYLFSVSENGEVWKSRYLHDSTGQVIVLP